MDNKQGSSWLLVSYSCFLLFLSHSSVYYRQYYFGYSHCLETIFMLLAIRAIFIWLVQSECIWNLVYLQGLDLLHVCNTLNPYLVATCYFFIDVWWYWFRLYSPTKKLLLKKTEIKSKFFIELLSVGETMTNFDFYMK